MKNTRRIFHHLILIVGVIICVLPILWVISSSLKTQTSVFSDLSLIPYEMQFQNYVDAWQKGNFSSYFFNSVFYTVTVVFGVLFISSLAGFALARLQLPGSNIIFLILISTMMIPIPGAFIALYVLLSELRLINTRLGYILCLISTGLPFALFLFKSFFDGISKDLEDAAEIDGCSKFQLYLKIALPLSKPIIAIVAIHNAILVWNEFLLAMVVLTDRKLMPLQRGLMVFQGAHMAEYHLLMAGIAITTIPVIIIYFLMQKHIISGVMAGALK
ncbi:MAG: carbohydrate ABC transporter permease [Elusimicrobiota bacterium]